MKIVFVFDGLQTGGIESVGVNYIKLLKNRGHDISIINLVPHFNDLYSQIPEDCPLYEVKLPRNAVPYRYARCVEYGIPGAMAYAGISAPLALANSVYKICKRKLRNQLSDTDVVIAFSGHYNDLMFVASGYIPGKKMAWLHGAEFEYKLISDGYFAMYKKIRNLVCLSELCDIICSKFNEENMIRKELIYNPVLIKERPVDQNKVEMLKSTYGRFALMAARLAPDKDQKTAIRAIDALNKKNAEKIHLLLAGDGVNRANLEQFTAELGTEEYVHFLGNCTDMQNYYSAAYVYVHSSPMEGLPTVLLEAMHYDLPIAATDSIPGVREILGKNECGLISPVGDWKQLGENIGKLCKDNDLRAEMIKRGQERIKDFDPEESVNKVERFMEEI